MDEVVDQLRRMQKGIPVSDETLAVAVISEGGRQGEFLSHPHTLKHLRGTQWRPNLMNRMGFEQWEREGRKDLLTRARERMQALLQDHQPRPIDPRQAQRVEACVEQYREKLRHAAASF
jgi:trimethylamine--corrinoid protein Co-methyltransferase